MIKKSLFYLIFIIVIASAGTFIVREMPLYVPNGDFRTLKILNNNNYDSINLALESCRDVMLAANFLGSMKLYSIEEAYFPKIELQPEKINARNPLLTTMDSCLVANAIDITKLSGNFILISRIRPLENNIYYFNKKPYCNGLKIECIRGFSVMEPWGRWSDGNTVEFAITVDRNYPQGGKLLLDIRPVINPQIGNDTRIVGVILDGKPNKEFHFSSDIRTTMEISFDKKEPGTQINVVMNFHNPMRFSDMAGNDSRQVSVGFLSAEIVDESIERRDAVLQK